MELKEIIEELQLLDDEYKTLVFMLNANRERIKRLEKEVGNLKNINKSDDNFSEEVRIKNALILNNGNRERTAIMLGVSQRTIYRKIIKYKLEDYAKN